MRRWSSQRCWTTEALPATPDTGTLPGVVVGELDSATIDEIVDDVFMPLVRHHPR